MLSYNAAEEICKTLFNAGFTAYFAGGWVRDHLLGHPSEEIDIATSAPPETIQRLFHKTIPVGIAFGVVIVVKENHHFEVSTFRKDHPYKDGRHPEGVDFSTAEKDAQRRDFTINGMFYDPLTQTIHDYVGGRDDLHKKVVRAIGHPHERFAEDRLRMIRAVRFASRLRFHLDETTASAITAYAPTLLPAVSMERIWQELCKMAAYPHFDEALSMLHRLGLLGIIFPVLKNVTSEEISRRVAPFAHFPTAAPAMAYLLELFPDLPLEGKLELCLYLKTSLQERKLVEFFEAAKNLFSSAEREAYDWAYFYSHPLSDLYLGIEAAKRTKRIAFIEEHLERRDHLLPHIQRIQAKTPLLTSAHLAQAGVEAGKKMGLLLKRAEQIAINENLDRPEDVLKRLQNEISDS
ncbi:CCA tRNA nucleotidyltransferase [Chlamydiota bacterium]